MRISTSSTFRRVLLGLRQNQIASIRAQEQLASGRRILRPSDDPTGASRAIRIERQLGDIGRYRDSINAGRRTVDIAAASLTEGSGLMADARELILQGMNGTLSDQDRELIGVEFDLIRSQMLELGNQRSGEQYFFGGTETVNAPWEEITENGRTRTVYKGNEGTLAVRVGGSVDAEITLSGSEVFGPFDPKGLVLGGLSGAAVGTTANEGTGFDYVEFRHDATAPGTIGSVGLALANGGSMDTILGSNALTIANGTIQLGTGPAVPLPATSETDFVVKNELGAELHLDFSGYTGVDYSGVVTASGSASLDGTTFVPLTFTETDLELSDQVSGHVVHLDTTGVKRAGNEQAEFKGTSNVFDLLQTIADEMRNVDGLEPQALLERLGRRLQDIDRHHSNILVGTGILGARSQRLQVSDERASDVELQAQSLLSDVADADLAEVAIDLARSDYMLQLAQASGTRLIQTSLLNFLG